MPTLISDLPTYIPAEGKIIWIIDENMALETSTLHPYKNRSVVLSNRYDTYQLFQEAGFKAVFSDFSTTDALLANDSQTFRCLIYPISKEKQVCSQVLYSASDLLDRSANIILVGKKNQGIKSLYDKIRKSLPQNASIKKHATDYIVNISLNDEHRRAYRDLQLSDNFHRGSYFKFSHIQQIEGLKLYSKPGVFGWQKIDEGSTLLIDTIKNRHLNLAGKSTLDLGCGSGHLSLAAISLGASKLFATDNNAAALTAIKENIKKNALEEKAGLKITLKADDCAQSIDKKFDLILCNPPFHKGYSVSSTLSEKFLFNAGRLLKQDGEAWFVVNAFIGIEKLAKKYFSVIQMEENNNKFKVLRLKKPSALNCRF